MALMKKLRHCICPTMPAVPITDVIHCMICTGVLTKRKPQVLPCQHGFCTRCLQSTHGYPTTEVTCPTCRRPSPVPARGFPVEFPKDADCVKFLQRVTVKDTYSQDVPGQVCSNLHCRKHNENTVTSVCVTCSVPLCDKCLMEQCHRETCHDDGCNSMRRQLHDNSKSHKIKQLDDLVSEYSERLRQSQEEIERCIVGTKAHLAQMDKLLSIQSQRFEQAKCDLQRHVAQLIEQLKRRERELSNQLQQHHLQAELEHKLARDETVRSLHNLEAMDRFVKYLTACHTCDAHYTLDLLLNHDSVRCRIDRLLSDATDDDDIIDRLRQIHVVNTLDSFDVARLRPDKIPPAVIAPPEIPRVPMMTPPSDVAETSRMRLVDTCQLVTTLRDTNAFPEALTYLPDGHLVVAWQQVNIYNHEGTLAWCHNMKARGVSTTGVGGRIMATDKIGCELIMFCNPTNDRCYDLPFCFKSPGALHALSADQFLLIDILRKSVCKLSLPAQGNAVQIEWCTQGHLTEPCAIAVNQCGDIFVSDTAVNSVKVFDTNGCYLRQFGSDANMPCGQLKQPLGVCIDCYGNVLVADSGNHRVCMFDCDGLYIKDLVDKAGWPNMLALSPHGILAVTDKAQKIVRLFKVYENLNADS
ncbi:hypothetical protein NP493_1026g00023 [Ridgeia piscesae]|uniref:RING-type domain-containing protein n=1 Tax=Ridgeia piscesae TaxID=27915 RepID=A0AAD9KI48_RIDPI|nr:hypothetical protein NP493_1026g00023 [Ridgeia piscesae]